MPLCQRCREEVDEVSKVKVARKVVRLCETCREEVEQEEEVAKDAEGAMRGMMEYKGR